MIKITQMRMSCITGDLDQVQECKSQIMDLNPSALQHDLCMLYYYAAYGVRDSALLLIDQYPLGANEIYALLGMWDEYIELLNDRILSRPRSARYRPLGYLDEDPLVAPQFREFYQPLLDHPDFPAIKKELDRQYKNNVEQFSVRDRLLLPKLY